MRFPRLTAVTKASVGWVTSLFGDSTSARPARGWGGSGGWGGIHEPFAGAWQRGTELDPIGTLTANGSLYAVLTLIPNDIGKLGLLLLEKGAGGVKVPAPDAAPDWRALRKPNRYQTINQFLRQWMLSKLMHGNTYALKVREQLRGKVIALHILDARRVTPMVTPEGDVYYSLGGDDLAQIPTGQVVPASDIIHDRCCTLWHPLVGIPPLYAAAMSTTQARRIQANSSTFFENMSRPSGFLKVPGTLEEAKAQALKAAWEKNYSAGNMGRLAVLTGGMEYEAMAIPAEQSQLIEQLRWTASDICAPFHVPPYKIGVGPMPTNNNVEALNLEYYNQCLQTHIEDIERLLTEGLEVADGKCVELDLEGLLRMDSAAQMEMLARGVEKAIYTPNEARSVRRLLPKIGGDELYLQQQNFSLPALAKRDAKDDPFGKEPAPPPAPASPEPNDDEKRQSAMVMKAAEAATLAAIFVAGLAETDYAATT